ncbi:uncharacterized protein [Dermacentor albipictus]|uniref:uncharacterized protein n=1 Tax=Dermacentor albipictus TaxID=60249 RepID=UPI0031FDBFF6
MSASFVPEPSLAQGQTRTSIAGSKTARTALYVGLAASAGTVVLFACYFVAGEQQQKSFCCSDVMQLLAPISNRSVDPCSNFVDFACYRVKHLDQNKLGMDAVETAVVRPTLRGQLKMAAANRLHTHHRSCLAAFVEGALSPENAIRFVLSMFRDWSGSAEHIDLLKVLGLLHLRYNLPTVFAVSFSFRPAHEGSGVDRHSVRISGAYAPRLMASADAVVVENRMVAFLSTHLRQGTSREEHQSSQSDLRDDILRANFRLQDALQVFDDIVHTGDASLLQQLFPEHDLSSWREVLGDCCDSWHLEVQDPQNARNVFHVLEDGQTRSEAFEAYFAITIAMAVFSEEFTLAERTDDMSLCGKLCDRMARQPQALWDISSATVLTSANLDTSVRMTFDTMTAAVASEASELFANYTDSGSIRELVRSVRLLLPNDIARPYTSILPNLTDSYLQNKFTIRSFLFKVSVLDSARGLGGLRRLHTLNRFTARVGGHVVVSPRVYPMLSVDKGSQTVVNAASLGVSLADSLWDAVFSRREWSVPLLHRLDAHTSCLQRYVRTELEGRLSYPLLSVRSAVRAVSWPQWHARADDDWKLSASQVFFMLFVLRHACLARDHADKEATLSRRPFMLRVSHFAAAFDCKPAPLLGLGSCL